MDILKIRVAVSLIPPSPDKRLRYVTELRLKFIIANMRDF